MAELTKEIYFYCTYGRELRIIGGDPFISDRPNPRWACYPKEDLNGKICAIAKTSKIEEITYDGYSPKTASMYESMLLTRSCLTGEDFLKYRPKYAIIIDSVDVLEKPATLNELGLVKYNSAGGIMDRAPQSMEPAYTKNGKLITVMAIRPEYLIGIMRNVKTIELRRKLTKELKELLK